MNTNSNVHFFNVGKRFLRKPFQSLTWLALMLTISGCAQAQSQPQALETSYSDCSYVEFDEVDPSQLTREERIALEEAALFDSLDNSTKCMDQAAAASAAAVATAASGAAGTDGANVGGSAGNAGESSSTSASSEQQDDATTTSSSSSVTTKSHEGGKGKGGSSAVCDAVRAGLEGATTETEKAHFEGLMTEYGC